MSVRRAGVAMAAGALIAALTLGAGDARPTQGGGAVTISMLANALDEPAWNVLIPNFERVYPNIKVDATYATSAVASQLELTELAAGSAPDLLQTKSCGGVAVAACTLAQSGYLAPMVKAPWVKRSLPLVLSLDKYRQGLYAFSPEVVPFGAFTNDVLFRKFGLTVPQTFAQLLVLCQKAKADGTSALIFDGAAGVALLLEDLAVPTVYAKDKHWTAELNAGKVSFDGTPGWHQALQEFIDMNSAGCFQPGMTGTMVAAQAVEFAQGQGLMTFSPSISKGQIDAANPSFTYSFHPFPGGTEPNETRTFFTTGNSVSVNAHASAQNQAAAQTFIDFIARPKQNALFAQTGGGLTQYELLKIQIPSFMAPFKPVFKDDEYVFAPVGGNVYNALSTNGIGLVTGQRSIDDVLNAMDAAWKQGPS